LLASLNDGPEKQIMVTYASLYGDYGFDLPALIPQVYLHYDPHTRSQRNSPGPLVRQRMDFLLLLPKRRRVVIELDGQQHYADDNGRASPARYAEMVREDRGLRLAGYEVFRFGGQELRDPVAGAATVKDFFVKLLEAYGVTT
jgi:very-short-patch-repair endonuclease